MFKTEIVKNINSEEWDKLLLNSREATVFHTKEWLSVLEKTYTDRTIHYIIGRDQNGNLICGLPLIEYRQFGFSVFTSTIWGTPLLLNNMDESIREKVLKKFSELYKKINVIYLSQSDYSNKCQYLKNLGFECKNDFLHLLELRPPFNRLYEEIFKRCIRKNVRSATEKGIVLEEVKNISQVEQYYNIAADTYLRHGDKMRYSLDFYKNIFNIMSPKMLIKWHLAKKDNIVVAGTLHFIYKDMIFDFLNASHKEYQNLRPNDLLVYSMIKWGVENGYKYYNFGASPSEAKGLIRFKENWGAKKVEYLIYEKKSTLFKVERFLRNKWIKIKC